MSQARRFVELFVEVKSKQLDSIWNNENNVVLHRPPFTLFRGSKKHSKYLNYQSVSEGNTALYRVALKSKLTAAYRHFNTSFVELLLNSGISILWIFNSGMDRLRTNIIGRNTKDHNKKTQKAYLKIGSVGGSSCYQTKSSSSLLKRPNTKSERSTSSRLGSLFQTQ